MSFSFVSIKETDRLKDVYPKINAIGEELSKPNSIYKQLNDLKTTVSKYQTYKLTTDTGQYTSGQVINLDTVQGSKTVYGTITNPPKGLSGEGWISYKESEGSNTTLVNFYPIDSDSIYTKVRKLPKQTQNPNLLHDTTFSGLPMYGSYTLPEGVWWDTNGDRTTVNYPDPTVKYQGINTVRLQDTSTTYPMLRHKGLEVGKDVNIGDKVTLSVYVYTPDKSLFNGNNAYITITGYPGEIGSSNTSLATTTVYESDLENSQWKKLTCTATVPSTVGGSPIQYVSAMLRLSLTKGGFDNGLKVYYALPKLEKGTVATPYVSHPDDKIQFNELWSEWSEQKSKLQSTNDSVTDIHYDNYFKYAWWRDKVGTRTLQDLAYELPQGFHTFYAQRGIPGILPDASIRGMINVDYDEGHIDSKYKFVQMYYMDYFGNFYTQYYDANKGWYEPIKSIGSKELCTGTQDIGSNLNYIFNLQDNINNYDYIEIEYYTNSSSRFTETRKLKVLSNSALAITTTRMDAHDPTGTSISTWQAEFSIDNNTQITAKYCKRILVNASGNSSVLGQNTSGLFTIKRIVGIKE
ncbi:capsid and scaffold protein [Staphylococcus phage vB_SscM-2]|uniref:Capsid and scaffold protein n=1 Tax=Staphylococcus phage vB_SscM-2 TaxID=1868845 RepID=A0A1X9IA34_9CAUD|nr:capsid and scaffold protein [Staphylococcus phage vB_SscM-2]